MNDALKTYDSKETAAMLGVTPTTVSRYHAAGLLKSHHPRRIRCTQKDIEDCFEAMGTAEFRRKLAAHKQKHKTAGRGRPAGSADVRRLKREGKL